MLITFCKFFSQFSYNPFYCTFSLKNLPVIIAALLVDKTILVLKIKANISQITPKALKTLIQRPCNQRIDCLQEGLYQEGRGHWAVYYTSPQSFIITFYYPLV